MPRRDSAEATGAIWQPGQARAYSHYSSGCHPGSGGARPGLSQKGDLPSLASAILIWSKVADARTTL